MLCIISSCIILKKKRSPFLTETYTRRLSGLSLQFSDFHLVMFVTIKKALTENKMKLLP